MDIWIRNSSARILKSTRPGRDDSTHISLGSARRMETSVQLLLRDFIDFSVTDVEVSGLPENVGVKICRQDYITYNDGTPYPDILSPDASVSVSACATQGIWVTFFVGEHAPVGKFNITCTAKTSSGDFTATVALSIFPPVLPAPAESRFGHEYFFNWYDQFGKNGDRSHAPLPDFYDFDRYSDEWWSLMAEYAKTMKRLRVNCLNVNFTLLLREGGSRRIGETEWSFDFSLLDRFVDCFLENGSFNSIAMSSPIRSVTGETISGIGYNGGESFKIFEPDADRYVEALFSAIKTHLTETGRLPMLTLRIEDEPHSTEYWKWLRDKARLYLPDTPCGEPLDMHESATELVGYCDCYIPRINVYDTDPDFYHARSAAGDTLWCYSCCYPEESWYLNKFIDQPASYSRLLKWACFSNRIDGFLHWGFNYWSMTSLYGLGSGARFKGDGFIVYPDVPNGSLKMSARGINTIEGIQDWELLFMLAQTDRQRADAISQRICKGFTEFCDDDRLIEAARREILELLSQ